MNSPDSGSGSHASILHLGQHFQFGQHGFYRAASGSIRPLVWLEYIYSFNVEIEIHYNAVSRRDCDLISENSDVKVWLTLS